MSENVRLPSRFWVMIDAGLMTYEEAVAEWRLQQAAGVPFDGAALGA